LNETFRASKPVSIAYRAAALQQEPRADEEQGREPRLHHQEQVPEPLPPRAGGAGGRKTGSNGAPQENRGRGGSHQQGHEEERSEGDEKDGEVDPDELDPREDRGEPEERVEASRREAIQKLLQRLRKEALEASATRGARRSLNRNSNRELSRSLMRAPGEGSRRSRRR
jgi:hypothetical protein